MSTFNFPKHLRGKQDGSTVKDALDCYLPEWDRLNGIETVLAKGDTSDGERFIIKFDVQRIAIIRSTKFGQSVSHTVVGISQDKHDILSLSRGGDSLDETSDKRYLMMLSDLKRR